jgi:hypothetical protein
VEGIELECRDGEVAVGEGMRKEHRNLACEKKGME